MNIKFLSRFKKKSVNSVDDTVTTIIETDRPYHPVPEQEDTESSYIVRLSIDKTGVSVNGRAPIPILKKYSIVPKEGGVLLTQEAKYE